jgi:hypothetical protein
MKLTMLAGAAAVAALIATPAMAAKTQQKFSGPQQQSADSTGTKKMKKTQQTRLGESRAMATEQRGSGFTEQRGSGFWPADVATGVLGGAVNAAGVAVNAAGVAVNTAGAIATAPFTPFGGDSYAYYRDTSTMPNRGFIADANGPTCLPGQLTTIHGQRMRCQ